MIGEVAKPITHAELVQNLSKPGTDIASDLASDTESKVLLLLAAYGAVHQAEELDRAKKQAIYNKKLGLRVGSIDLEDPEGLLVNAKLSAQQADLLHMAVGIAGEAGELLHAVLSHIMNAEPIDMENTIEELGDLEFFMEGLRQNLNISRDETISHNIKKLSVRYNSGSYSDQQAQSRADKH